MRQGVFLQNILIVEDEIKIAELLCDYMKSSGFAAHMLHRGDEVLSWFDKNNPDLILLDLMLPGLDGIEICKRIRKTSFVPIIMLTAKVDEIDRLLGLELGADDYICKPFSPREVVARVKAVLRRSSLNDNRSEQQDPLEGHLKLDESSYHIIHQSCKAELTAIEFRLLKTLYDTPGHIYSREALMNQIYNDHRIVSDRTVDSHIKNLRKKLESVGIDGSIIHSVYSVGYKYE